MMIFSLVATIGLEKCCITSACLQWLCHSGERTVARGPLVLKYFEMFRTLLSIQNGGILDNDLRFFNTLDFISFYPI